MRGEGVTWCVVRGCVVCGEWGCYGKRCYEEVLKKRFQSAKEGVSECSEKGFQGVVERDAVRRMNVGWMRAS